MGTELQHLLDKIQAEGLDKAKAGADALLAQARDEAQRIVATARQQADAFSTRAQEDAAAYQQRATESIRQAGRNTLLDVEKAARTLLETLLLREIKNTLALSDVLARLTLETVQGYLAQGENVSLRLPQTAEALLPALRETLRREAEAGKVEIVLDPAQGTGFSARVENGRVEHDFSAEAVAAALAKTLRPQLAELLKQ
ncbi:MAG: hypothetical protein FWF96_04625 [Kiritimatiellaeota bacterium]|nr:hypothetical protein [Kiritimatiellota bacterium]